MIARSSKPPMSTPSDLARAAALGGSISDAADGIQCATNVMRDLLRLAIQELERTTGTRADAAIRAAERYVGDIEIIADHLHSLDCAAPIGGVA